MLISICKMNTNVSSDNIKKYNSSNSNSVGQMIEEATKLVKEECESDDDTKGDKIVEKKEPLVMNNCFGEQTMREEINLYEVADKQISHETCNYAVDDKLSVQETVVLISSSLDIKSEPSASNLYDYCEECDVEYESFCTRCPMLSHILHTSVWDTNDAKETIPKKFLEIRESLSYVGVFALKTLPKDIIFGPYPGLASVQSITGSTWKIKSGKLINSENENSSNWMRYINFVENVIRANLFVFQNGGNLYYQSDRRINKDEELLVYFSGGYSGSLNDEETNYVPIVMKEIGNVYACTFCCLGFSSEVHLIKHKTMCPYSTNEDAFEEFIQCFFCKVYLNEREYLRNHKIYCCKHYTRKYNSNEEMLVCQSCNFKGKDEESLETHIKDMHRSVQTFEIKRKPAECRVCNKSFATKQNLKIHIQIHSGEKPFHCHLCDYKSVYKKCLTRHLTNHEGVKPFECKICSKTFAQKEYLAAHVRIHSGEKPYECTQCDYKCTRKELLVLHDKNVHGVTSGPTKDHKCPKCDFQTDRKDALKRHVNMHDGTFKCEVCSRCFSSRDSLNRHIVTHTGEKLFACQLCDHKCILKGYLRQHMLDKHGERSAKVYKCTECSYETQRRYSLRAHLIVHTGLKPFECEVCGKRFSRKYTLKAHHLAHGGEERFPCVQFYNTNTDVDYSGLKSGCEEN